jgi:hypothetical protein
MIRSIVVALALVVPAAAHPQSTGAPKPNKPAARPPAPLTPEREATALAFAKTNHPELAELLGNLKTMDGAQYHKAVSALATQSESLAALAKRDPEIHAVALREWKTQSRINVLAAKVTHLDPAARPAAETELKKFVEEQADLRISRKELDVKRATEQLQRSEDQLQKLKSDRDSWIAQQLKRWLRSKDAKPKSKPKPETPPTKPEPKP